MLLLVIIRSIMIICIKIDNVFFSKTYPSFLTVKEGSTSLTKPLFPQGREENRPTVLIFLPLRLSCKESSTFSPSPSSSGSGDVTALRCSEPLRSKVGGPSKVSPCFAGWDRLGYACELKHLGLWKFAGAVRYVLHEVLRYAFINMTRTCYAQRLFQGNESIKISNLWKNN